MSTVSLLVSSFIDREAADAAGHRLYHAGFPMAQVSVVCKDWLDAADPDGYHSRSDANRMSTEAFAGAGGILGMLAGFAVVGPFARLGPIAGLVAGSAIGGSAGRTIGWWFYGMEDPNEPEFVVAAYEEMLHQGKALLIVHGDKSLAETAEPILQEAGAIEVRHLVKPA
jgi:hypothetical protein